MALSGALRRVLPAIAGATLLAFLQACSSCERDKTQDGGAPQASGCAGKPDRTPCDDGDDMTAGDRCLHGVCKGDAIRFVIAFTDGGVPSFVAPGDRLTARIDANASDLANSTVWEVKPGNAVTGPAALEQGRGPRLVFQPASVGAHDGSRSPNPPLEYEIVARASWKGRQFEARMRNGLRFRQSEADVLRQEYLDYGTAFVPGRTSVAPPPEACLNTGNYTVIAEEKPGSLGPLLQRVGARLNALLAQRGKPPVEIDALVTSGFRNPQRNRAVGSTALNSRHVRGRALDLSPHSLDVPGLGSEDLMCLIEQAGQQAAGPGGRAFTERGATTFLDCDSPAADHVHVEL